jgi:hypothetical protein
MGNSLKTLAAGTVIAAATLGIGVLATAAIVPAGTSIAIPRPLPHPGPVHDDVPGAAADTVMAAAAAAAALPYPGPIHAGPTALPAAAGAE